MELENLDSNMTSYGQKIDLPGAGGVLTTGIVAIPFGFGLIVDFVNCYFNAGK